MNADKLTRWTAVAAVLAVAGVAAWISYRHAVEVVTAHGEPGAVGHWYPVVIDGLIVAASMVLLDAARHREPPPRLAWWMLGAGIVATLAVNVLAGVPSGWLGAVVAAWPALAFVGCYELLMMLVRSAARRAVAEPENVPQATTGDAPQASTGSEPENAPATAVVPVPASSEQAAAAWYRAALASGFKVSQRQLADQFGLPRSRVANLVKSVAAEASARQLGDDQADTEDIAA